MEAVRTSETSVDNYFTRQYIPEDNSEQGKIFLAWGKKKFDHPAIGVGYDKVSKIDKLIVVLFSGSFLCIISNSSCFKFVIYYLKFRFSCHVCILGLTNI
jgi:hypothetical protein